MIIEGNSVSECWISILNVIVNHSGKEISPLIVKINVTDFDAYNYHGALEDEIDLFAKSHGEPPIETTAGTIFPDSLSGGNECIFDRFEKIWKHVKRDTKNRHGHYFRRLTAYAAEYDAPRKVNQLQHIIDTYNGKDQRQPVHRRSALIATTFDPTLDHKAVRVRGFPCLQQVCFIPKEDELTITAIYAMQYISTRGYGNYIGLIRLGHFMAEKMGLRLTSLQCIASVMSLGDMTKNEAKNLVGKYYSAPNE